MSEPRDLRSRGKFYVAGGRQRGDVFRRKEWQHYEAALIYEFDADTGACVKRVEYVSPPEAIPSEEAPSIVFKAGTTEGGRFYACTQTEVLVYRLPDFVLERYVSLPVFNDVHHVRPRANGNLLVVSTGLDTVFEVDPEDRVVAEYGVLGQDPWARFDRGIDYRKVPTTKPHAAHPNYAFEVDGEIWATRFEQRDAVCLTKPQPGFEVGVERVHDGFVFGRKVFLTSVNGHVAVGNLDRGRLESIVDLQRVTGMELALGWTRGLCALSEQVVVVGFSRLRPTKFRENVRWVKHQFGMRAFKGDLPSRIGAFDLAAERLLWEVNVEKDGLNAIFSVHQARGDVEGA